MRDREARDMVSFARSKASTDTNSSRDGPKIRTDKMRKFRCLIASLPRSFQSFRKARTSSSSKGSDGEKTASFIDSLETSDSFMVSVLDVCEDETKLVESYPLDSQNASSDSFLSTDRKEREFDVDDEEDRDDVDSTFSPSLFETFTPSDNSNCRQALEIKGISKTRCQFGSEKYSLTESADDSNRVRFLTWCAASQEPGT